MITCETPAIRCDIFNCRIDQMVEVKEECDNYIFNYLIIIHENIWDNEETEHGRILFIIKNILILWYHIFWLLVANITLDNQDVSSFTSILWYIQ